jgi:hypothetical protein
VPALGMAVLSVVVAPVIVPALLTGPWVPVEVVALPPPEVTGRRSPVASCLVLREESKICS